MKPAISVHNLSKKYRLGTAANRDNNLTENIRYHAKNAWDKLHRLVHPKKDLHHDESFWALKDVSFEVQPGEVVGIIGRNGAGKSTLLKVLSQIVEPTSGHAIVRGRMGSLLEVGTGFHPELTGRENVYLNGAILGMTREEINKKFDEIVEFAEVEKFLDTPVKRYSSGMYVRLAFSVAAHLEPEILIVDEVLAVGDASFQEKCLTRIHQSTGRGATALIVSHQLQVIRSVAKSAILLNRGRVVDIGETTSVLKSYSRLIQAAPSEGVEQQKWGDEGRFLSIAVRDAVTGEVAQEVQQGTLLRLDIRFELAMELPEANISVDITTSQGQVLFSTTWMDDRPPPTLRPGPHAVSVEIPTRHLRPGDYSATVFLLKRKADVVSLARGVEMPSISFREGYDPVLESRRAGVVEWPCQWSQK